MLSRPRLRPFEVRLGRLAVLPACTAALALVVGAGCSLIAPFSVDRLRDHGADAGDGGEAGGDADGAGGDGSRGDADATAGEPGAVTLVLSSLELTTDRLCDLDGDGSADNAIAELGNPNSSIFATYLNEAIDRFFSDEFSRIVAHLPWVDDVGVEDLIGPTDPEATLIFATAIPADGVWDDDFEGGSHFVSLADSLDACGEPVHVFEETALEAGAVTARSGEMPLPMGSGVKPATVAELTGTVEPRAGGAELHACAYVTIRQFGELLAPSWFEADQEDLRMLEVILAGGAVVGLPVPGVEPDLDLDGDGLEQVELDAESLVVRCVDGDRTVIEGRDCWTDERIADGFALAISSTAVSAHLDGPEEGWAYWAQGSCLHRLECLVGCQGWCLCEPICATGQAAAEALRSCMTGLCLEYCDDWNFWSRCVPCAESRCRDVTDACAETDCCPDPPEQSLWDPI